jgi:carboxyl-terminal processing protease
MKPTALVSAFLFVFILGGWFPASRAYGQGESPKSSSTNPMALREMFIDWLNSMQDAIKDEYYDPKYHGIDLNARFNAARNSITKLDYDWQMFRVLAQIVIDFDDAHTSLLLPPRKEHFDYGFEMQIFGSDCLVKSVTRGSDAERAGLEVGDKIVKIGEFVPDRNSLWKLEFILKTLAPPPALEITVKKDNLPEKTLDIKAAVTNNKEYQAEQKKIRDKSELVRCTPMNKEIIACKLYTFEAEKGDVDKMMKQAAGYQKLILDLRGNGGGLVKTDEYLTGYFFDHDVKMADVISRKKTQEHIAKSKGKNAFTGDLAVLVDSDSASASEVFARVMQLQKRGKVIGDTTAGFVMESTPMALVSLKARFGYNTKVFPLFINLSVGDVVMSDGARLEKKGVIPDTVIIPSGTALKVGMDPALAEASNALGFKLSPEDAGKLGFLKNGLPPDEPRADQ